MADEVVGISAASDTRVYFDTSGVPHCPNCETALDHEGSVTFTERYEASVCQSMFGICIKRSHCDFSTEGCCASCGQMLDYEDVD